MKIEANTIKLFDNLAQVDYLGTHFDFHNEYLCTLLNIANGELSFQFTPLKGTMIVLMRFYDVEMLNLQIVSGDINKDLTIDNLYRGRFETHGRLHEFSDKGKGYFYLEFVEEIKFEFLSSGFSIASENKN